MFENVCTLLLWLYPAEFRRAYGDEAVQLIVDRARHERGVLLRVRLLVDLAIDLGAISRRGWHPSRPLLARIDGAPRFDIVDIHGPRPMALAGGMLTSLLVFATFTLLFQPTTRPDAAAHRGQRSGTDIRGVNSPKSAHRASAGIGVEPDLKGSRTEAVEATKDRVGTRRRAAADVAQSEGFAVISINTARSRDMRMRVMPNGDLHATALPVLLLLRYAYDVPVNPSPRFSGLPYWRETFDIETKAPANAVSPGLPEREQQRRRQAMVRALLADRFKLVIRLEHRSMPVYALTVASGGPKLQKATIAEKDCVFDTGTQDSCHTFVVGRGHPLNAAAVTMDDLAQYIENWTDLPVVNHTAIGGLFAVETEGWRPMRLPPPPPGMPAQRFDDLPTIFTVLRTLGLELKRLEATVPVYIVERIERPTANEDGGR